MRFFMRAITNYDEGLQKHPSAFDLAYNKYVFQRSTLFRMIDSFGFSLFSGNFVFFIDTRGMDIILNSQSSTLKRQRLILP